jgi:uncharacterized membrane protein YczE
MMVKIGGIFMKKDNLKRRIIMCIVGVLVCGISVGFFKRAAFGVDPFQVFMAGLDALVPIPFGILYIIANVCLLLFSLVFDRHFIGLGTFINLFLLGYVVDFSRNILFELFPNLGIVGRIVFLAIGIIVMCLASSLYFTADLGVSTYDAVALIISGTWRKGQFKWVRVICDFVCVILGVVLYFMSGGESNGLLAIVGIGTIITAFFMGPLIDFFNRKVAQVILNR